MGILRVDNVSTNKQRIDSDESKKLEDVIYDSNNSFSCYFYNSKSN